MADLFCGAGGTSKGAEKAVRTLGASMVLAAINHWPLAIETHRRNHPTARHYVEDVTVVKPREIVPDGYLDLLMASPECTHFSRARGGKPIHDQSRMNAWTVQRWVTDLDVRCLLIENVPEFIEWGPLLPNGKVDPKRKGTYFLAWIRALQEMGYDFEHRIINAADFGDATTRQRFFGIARKDGVPIRWPEPTHAPADLADMFGGRRERWRAAREIIDWSAPGRSLLDDPKYRKRPLSEKTRRRIARGLERFGGPLAPLYVGLLGLEAAGDGNSHGEPFVCANRNHNAPRSLDEPIPPATTTTGGGVFLVEPKAEPFVLPQGGGGVAREVTEPVRTVACDGAIALVEPMVAPYYSNGSGETCQSSEQPLPTITTRARFALAEPLAVPYGPKAEARSVDQPLPTILTKDRLAVATPTARPFVLGRHSTPSVRDTDDPLPTATGSGGGYLVEPFLVAHFGERAGQLPRVHSIADPLPAVTSRGGGEFVYPVIVQMALTHQAGPGVRSADEPLYTITTGGRLGLIEPVLQAVERGEVDPRRLVLIDGTPYLLDIRFRMLSNRELARAMSFDDAEVEYEFVGNTGEVTKQIGNAVPVRTATALVATILEDSL